MESVGILFVLVAALLFRQVAVGRADNIRQDWHDYVAAFFSGDSTKLAEVAARRGHNLPTVSTTDSASPPTSGPGASGTGAQVLSEMHRLAAIANNKYVYGAEGPNAYDCSGLVWRAMYNLGVYRGPRFTTEGFKGIAPSIATRVDVGSASPGDVLLWTGAGVEHMGVYEGGGKFYSALNSSKGIVSTAVAPIGNGAPPSAWRLK